MSKRTKKNKSKIRKYKTKKRKLKSKSRLKRKKKSNIGEKELIYRIKNDWINKAQVNKSQYEKKYNSS